MHGSVFLFVYLALIVAAYITARVLQRKIFDRPQAETVLDLSPAETAFLVGGRRNAFLSSLARMVQSKQLRVDADSGKPLFFPAMPLTAEDELSTKLYEAAWSEGSALYTLSGAAEKPLDNLEKRLEKQGLFVTAEQTWKARIATFLLFLVVGAIGFVRLMHGSVLHKPVGFLLLLMLVAFVAFLFANTRFPRRTPQGDQVLRNLREQHTGLETTAKAKLEHLGPDEVAMAVALFGGGVLVGSELAPITRSFPAPVVATGGSCGGGCGSSSIWPATTSTCSSGSSSSCGSSSSSSCGSSSSSCGSSSSSCGGGSSCGGSSGCGGCGSG